MITAKELLDRRQIYSNMYYHTNSHKITWNFFFHASKVVEDSITIQIYFNLEHESNKFWFSGLCNTSGRNRCITWPPIFTSSSVEHLLMTNFISCSSVDSVLFDGHSIVSKHCFSILYVLHFHLQVWTILGILGMHRLAAI